MFSLSCVAAERLSVLGLVEDRPVEQAQDGGGPSGGTLDRSGIAQVTVLSSPLNVCCRPPGAKHHLDWKDWELDVSSPSQNHFCPPAPHLGKESRWAGNRVHNVTYTLLNVKKRPTSSIKLTCVFIAQISPRTGRLL